MAALAAVRHPQTVRAHLSGKSVAVFDPILHRFQTTQTVAFSKAFFVAVIGKSAKR